MSDKIYYDEHKKFRFDFRKAKYAVETDKYDGKKLNIKGFFLTDFLIETEKKLYFFGI